MVAFRLLPCGGLAGHSCLVGCSHSLGRTGTSFLWLLNADGGERLRGSGRNSFLSRNY